MVSVQLLLGLFIGIGYGWGDDAMSVEVPSVAESQTRLNTFIVQPAHDVTVTSGEVLHAIAAATGENSDMASFTWTLVNVTAGVATSFFGKEVDIPFPEPGFFLLQCAARVGATLVDLTPAFRHVTVVAPNHPPETSIVEPIGDVTAGIGETVYFEAMGTDPDDDALTFRWHKMNPMGDVVGPVGIGVSVEWSFSQEGIWRVSCTAVDVHGDSDPTPAWVDVNVTASNLPPDTVIVSPQSDVEIDAGDRVSFEGMAVGDDSPGISINWQVTGGVTTRFFRGKRVTVLFPNSGRFEVFCSARNVAGESDPTPDSRTVIVRSMSSAIQTQIIVPERDLVVAVGSLVAFEAQGQPENASFEWEISRNGVFASSRYASGPSIEIDFPNIGMFEVTCTAVTDSGERDPTPARRHVGVVRLSASIVQPPGQSMTVPLGTEIPFQGITVSASPQSVTTYWYMHHDPENRISGNSARFVFDETGTFSVIFEVTDDLGNRARDYRVIHVSEVGALGVRILDPAEGSIFSVDEILHLEGQLFGSAEVTPNITWTLAGQAYSTLEVRDVTVQRPGRYNLTLVASVPERRLYATDQVMIEIYDPDRAARTEICEPLTDLTILPGDTVYFDGKHRNHLRDSDSGPYWIVTNSETDEVLLEAHRQTLGRVTFPEQEGEYIVSFALVGPSFEGPADLRRIRVSETPTELFNDNDAPERAVMIEPGRYRNLRLIRPNYFKVALDRDGTTLKVDLDFDGAAHFSVFSKIGALEWNSIHEGELSGSGGFQMVGLPSGEYLIRLAAQSVKNKSDLEFGIGVSVLQPALFFPDIREDGLFTTSIGVVNPNGELAEIDMTAFDADGSILEKVSADLAAHSRLHVPVASLFGEFATQVAWVRVDSSFQVVGYCVSTSHDKAQSYAMTGAEKLSSELFVPHIAQQTQQWYSRASVVNGSSEISESLLVTQTEDRDLLVEQSFSQDAFDFVEKFGGLLPESAQWGICSEEKNALLLAGTEVFGKNDGNQQVAGLILDDVQQNNPNFLYISQNIYFTHIARDVAQFWTGLALVNVSDESQTARMVAYGTGGALVGELEMQLDPGEKLLDLAEFFFEDLSSPEEVDWVALEADGAIVGYELFGSHDDKRLAGLEAGTALSQRLSFPLVDASGAAWHGLAVVNVHDTTSEANFTLYDDVGTVLATQTVALDPHEKLAITLTQLFGFLPPTAGWVLCESDQALTGFELVGDHASETLSALSAL